MITILDSRRLLGMKALITALSGNTLPMDDSTDIMIILISIRRTYPRQLGRSMLGLRLQHLQRLSLP